MFLLALALALQPAKPVTYNLLASKDAQQWMVVDVQYPTKAACEQSASVVRETDSTLMTKCVPSTE